MLPQQRPSADAANWVDTLRPAFFADVIGQQKTVSELRDLVARGRKTHVILAGPSGAGKTTLAQIIAKGSACQSRTDGEPCGLCRSCLSIASGARQAAYHALDATGELGGKDALLEYIDERLALPPFPSPFHIVFIDEAQRLSHHARDLLLKKMEGDDAKIIFIFALINKDQLPEEFRARCRTFDLERPTVEEKLALLERVTMAKQLDVEPGALALIAHLSRSLREGVAGLQRVHDLAEAGA